jgi:hypothetical protein
VKYLFAVPWIRPNDDIAIIGASSHFSSISLQNPTEKTKTKDCLIGLSFTLTQIKWTIL